jgi:hypothetical protein
MLTGAGRAAGLLLAFWAADTPSPETSTRQARARILEGFRGIIGG